MTTTTTIPIPARRLHDPRTGAFIMVDAVHAQRYHATHPHLVDLDAPEGEPPPSAVVGEPIRLCDAAEQYSIVAQIEKANANQQIRNAIDAGRIPSRKDGGVVTIDAGEFIRWAWGQTLFRARRAADAADAMPSSRPARKSGVKWQCACGCIMADSPDLSECPECGADAGTFQAQRGAR